MLFFAPTKRKTNRPCLAIFLRGSAEGARRFSVELTAAKRAGGSALVENERDLRVHAKLSDLVPLDHGLKFLDVDRLDVANRLRRFEDRPLDGVVPTRLRLS